MISIYFLEMSKRFALVETVEDDGGIGCFALTSNWAVKGGWIFRDGATASETGKGRDLCFYPSCPVGFSKHRKAMNGELIKPTSFFNFFNFNFVY